MALHNPEEDRRRQEGTSMPTPAESLSKESSDQEIKAAIAATVSMLVEEGFPQEQAVAVAINMAKRATGKDTGERQSGVRRAS